MTLVAITDELKSINQMTLECPVAACVEAYWDNERFSNSLLDAPERMQAAFDVLAEWCDQLCYSDTAERLREASSKLNG